MSSVLQTSSHLGRYMCIPSHADLMRRSAWLLKLGDQHWCCIQRRSNCSVEVVSGRQVDEDIAAHPAHLGRDCQTIVGCPYSMRPKGQEDGDSSSDGDLHDASILDVMVDAKLKRRATAEGQMDIEHIRISSSCTLFRQLRKTSNRSARVIRRSAPCARPHMQERVSVAAITRLRASDQAVGPS